MCGLQLLLEHMLVRKLLHVMRDKLLLEQMLLRMDWLCRLHTGALLPTTRETYGSRDGESGAGHDA